MALFIRPCNNGLRGVDAFGNGAFLAGRTSADGAHRHRGVDYVNAPGEAVLSPVVAIVDDYGFAYRGDARYRIITLRHPLWIVRLYYATARVKVAEDVDQGEVVGSSEDLGLRDPGIINHCHCEVIATHAYRLPDSFQRGKDYEMLADAAGEIHTYLNAESLAAL